MRKSHVFLLPVSLAAAVLLSCTSLVQASEKIACEAFAEAAADEWAAGYIDRAEVNGDASDNQVLIIAAGKKYYVPTDETGIIPSVGFRIRERSHVYHAEYRRCLRGAYINVMANQ